MRLWSICVLAPFSVSFGLAQAQETIERAPAQSSRSTEATTPKAESPTKPTGDDDEVTIGSSTPKWLMLPVGKDDSTLMDVLEELEIARMAVTPWRSIEFYEPSSLAHPQSPDSCSIRRPFDELRFNEMSAVWGDEVWEIQPRKDIDKYNLFCPKTEDFLARFTRLDELAKFHYGTQDTRERIKNASRIFDQVEKDLNGKAQFLRFTPIVEDENGNRSANLFIVLEPKIDFHSAERLSFKADQMMERFGSDESAHDIARDHTVCSLWGKVESEPFDVDAAIRFRGIQSEFMHRRSQSEETEETLEEWRELIKEIRRESLRERYFSKFSDDGVFFAPSPLSPLVEQGLFSGPEWEKAKQDLSMNFIRPGIATSVDPSAEGSLFNQYEDYGFLDQFTYDSLNKTVQFNIDNRRYLWSAWQTSPRGDRIEWVAVGVGIRF